MAKTNPWHSICPTDKPVYHNDTKCTEGNNIETRCRREGDAGRQLCANCRDIR